MAIAPSSGKLRSYADLLSTSVVCMLLVLWWFYPGMMSNDSFEQYRQARAFVFDSGNPPVMALVWHYTDRLIRGPFGMLLVQNLAFWSSVSVLVAVYATHQRRRWLLVPLVGLWPPVLAWLMTIWKDTGMITALLLGFTLIVLARRTGRKAFAWASLLPLFYAGAARHNAFAALLPVTWLLAGTLIARRRRHVFMRGGVALALLCGLLSAKVGTERWLCEGRFRPIQQLLFDFDLAGIVTRAKDPAVRIRWSAALGVPMPPEKIESLYTADTVLPLVLADPSRSHLSPLPFVDDSFRVHDLGRAWLAAIEEHPGAYLGHRLSVMSRLLAIEGPVFEPYHPRIYPNEFGIAQNGAIVNRWGMRYLELASRGPPFWGFSYLLLSAGILIAIFSRRRTITAAGEELSVLLLSGWTYLGLGFFVLPAAEFRYLAWTVLSAWSGFVLWLAQRKAIAAS